MRLVKYYTEIPEENIALDELLLEKAEKEGLGETLRFWVSDKYFAVAGRSSKIFENCIVEKCRRDKIKIIRRISGGGTVLQGPGCFNYSAVLSFGRDERFRGVGYSYERTLKRIVELLKKWGIQAEFRPISDLAVGGNKISGNSQARKRSYFLQHGTFLIGFDIGRVSRYLKHPPSEPEYRKGRDHSAFLANISVPEDGIQQVIRTAFDCDDLVWQPSKNDTERLNSLVSEKYCSEKWNFCF